MEKVFKEIFQAIQNDIQRNLEADNNPTPDDSSDVSAPQGGGTIPFDFQLDSQGNYHFETKRYGGGFTIKFCAYITDPPATYSIKVASSDGGGGQWNNVVVNQKECGSIDTSLLHKTTITVDLHASVANQSGHGVIEYSY
ncbi:MAG TPA: hypothetical protein VNN73_13295 [Blastocatellia bacterium]|nr:hypothetical protein [Blastocatellia bacterium]